MTFSNWLYENTHRRNRSPKPARPAASLLPQRSPRTAVERLEERRLLSAATADFAAAQVFPSGAQTPQSIVVGDFNGDGKDDLAVGHSNGAVGVLLGSGTAGFTPSGSFGGGGTSAFFVATGDLNGDGRDDIAVANINNNSVGVLLNDGAGGFDTAVNYATTSSLPTSIAIGDFNKDGLADLVVGHAIGLNVSLFAGIGGGSFAPAVSRQTFGQNPLSVAVADFNHDGNEDIAVAHRGSNTVGVLLGNGAGGFATAPAGAFATGGTTPGPFAIAVGDLDGDGNLDIAVANRNTGTVGVLLGDGAGGFADVVNYASGGSQATSIAIADFNNDGQPDVAVANFVPGNVGVLMGEGTGVLAPVMILGSGGQNATSIAVGDFNGDGKKDLAAANTNSHNVGVLLNTTSTNQPPANTVPRDQTIAEDVPVLIGGFAVSDDDAGGILTVTFTVAHGTVRVNDFMASGVPATNISGNNTSMLSLTGTQAQINVSIATYPGGLLYSGNKDFNGLDTLTMTTTDAGGLSATSSVAIQVLSAGQQADLLATSIADLAVTGVLSGGQATSLTNMLSLVQLSNGQVGYQGFYHYVNGMISANILTQQQGMALITAMSSIRASLA